MLGEIAALAAACCWALSAVMYKSVLPKTSYLVANLVRSAFAVIFLLSILPLVPLQSSAMSIDEIALLTFAAVTNLVIGDTLYFMGLKKVGVSRAQPISSSYPLFSILLAALFLGEPLTYAVLIGTPLIVVGTIAVSLTVGKTKEVDMGDNSSLVGAMASVAAAIFWSIGLVTYKIALVGSNVDTTLTTFVRTASILPFLLGMILVNRETSQLRHVSKHDIAVLGVAGILALGVGGILLFLSLSLIDASRAIPLSSISPLISLMLARRYSGEKITVRVVTGTVLIVAGVVLVTMLGQQ